MNENNADLRQRLASSEADLINAKADLAAAKAKLAAAEAKLAAAEAERDKYPLRSNEWNQHENWRKEAHDNKLSVQSMVVSSQQNIDTYGRLLAQFFEAPPQQPAPPPSTSFPLTDEEKEYIGNRVYSIDVQGGLKGTACAIKCKNCTGFVTSRHLFTSDADPDGALISCPFNVSVCDKHGVKKVLQVGTYCEVDDVLFFEYPTDPEIDTFDHVSIPPHTQLVYHAMRDHHREDDGDTKSIKIEDYRHGTLQVSSGFANYESPSVVMSSAYAARGWSGGPVLTISGGFKRGIVTLVGIVREGSIAAEDRRCADVMPRVVVQLLPHDLLTTEKHPSFAAFGATAVTPPLLKATMNYVTNLKLQPHGLLHGEQVPQLPLAPPSATVVAHPSESGTTSASTTNSSLPPATNEHSSVCGESDGENADVADNKIVK